MSPTPDTPIIGAIGPVARSPVRPNVRQAGLAGRDDGVAHVTDVLHPHLRSHRSAHVGRADGVDVVLLRQELSVASETDADIVVSGDGLVFVL